MRSLGLQELSSPADARKLAAEMGVDGLIVGSVTAFDPYNPPTLGISLALYARPGPMDARGEERIDTRELTYQASDYEYFPVGVYTDKPASVASGVLDGNNHQVLMDLDRYVEGRDDPTYRLGTNRYLASMELFTEFAAWRMVGQLVEQEWLPPGAGRARRGRGVTQDTLILGGKGHSCASQAIHAGLFDSALVSTASPADIGPEQERSKRRSRPRCKNDRPRA